MDLKALRLISMIDKKMNWLAQRQNVLAQNIGNADTPEYAPRDLVKLDFKRTLAQQFNRLPPQQTDSRHLKGTLPLEPRFFNPEVDQNYESAPDGNSVVLEEQMTKVAETGIQYQTATMVYKRYLRMFRTAVGRNGG